MYIQQEKGIPPTIPNDPIDDHETERERERERARERNQKIENKKDIYTIISFFAYHHCKETLTYLLPMQVSSVRLLPLQTYPQNFYFAISNYTQIQICNTSKISSNYHKILKQIKCKTNVTI